MENVKISDVNITKPVNDSTDLRQERGKRR
jgi:hypothetical protein